MTLIMHAELYKRVYPLMLEDIKPELTAIKKFILHFDAYYGKMYSTDTEFFLSSLVSRMSRLEQIKNIFYRFNRAFPEGWEKDPQLVAYHDEVRRYILGVTKCRDVIQLYFRLCYKRSKEKW